MKRGDWSELLRQGVWSPETPRERRQREDLSEDLVGSPVAGRPLPLRLRNFRPTADGYASSIAGPRSYMLRLRTIERMTEELEDRLAAAWHELASECAGDDVQFERSWCDAATAWLFDEVNDLIEAHNRWYPVESRLPMDPTTRDFALVNGTDYRRALLDAEWALLRFPPRLELAALGGSYSAYAGHDGRKGQGAERAAE